MTRKYTIKKPRPVLHVQPKENGPVKERRRNDVLSGRGKGISAHPGNVLFQETVKLRKKDYLSKTKMEKAHIAAQIVQFIRSLDPPGRFLKEDPKDGCWYEIGDAKAIQKTSQALREGAGEIREDEQQEAQSMAHQGAVSHPGVFTSNAAAAAAAAAASVPYYHPWGVQNQSPAEQFLMTLLGGVVAPPASVPYPVQGYNHHGMFNNTSTGNFLPQEGTALSTSTGAAEGQGRAGQPNAFDVSRLRRASRGSLSSSVGDNREQLEEIDTETPAGEFMFNTLVESIKDSSQEKQRESDDLTNEEKQTAMADIFGRMCVIDPQPKRLKRHTNDMSDRDPKGMKSLIEELKLEILRIPEMERTALSKALQKAPLRELSFARIQLFLKREEWDPKRAARRLVTYWEERRKWFGEDKFCLPMTLDGAMRDDTAVLTSRWAQLLPGLDASGRQILYNVLRCCGKEGYSSESSVRVGFYLHDLIAEHPNASEGYVRIITAQGASVLDFDGTVYRVYFRLIRDAWPVSVRATHFVCLPPLVSQILRVAILSWNREFRLRLILHDGTHHQLVRELAEYGISEDMIPIELGGTCTHDHLEWLSQRRELEREREHEELRHSADSKPASRQNMLLALANVACQIEETDAGGLRTEQKKKKTQDG